MQKILNYLLELQFQMNMRKLIYLKNLELLNQRLQVCLRLTKQYAKKIGLSFHVGSQCMHPISYTKGIEEIGNIIKTYKNNS